MKTQNIRLADVFIIGPMMIYAATRLKNNNALSIALGISGALTIIYNAHNYNVKRGKLK